MLLRGLQGLVHALAYGNRRHHNDKLAPTVALVQLVHGFDVGIGLAGAGFHLNRKVDARSGQRVRGFQPVAALHGLYILQQTRAG